MKDRSNAKVELSQAMEHEYPSRRKEEEKCLAQEGFEDVVDVDDIMTRMMKSGTNSNSNTNNGARPSVQVDLDEFIRLAGQPAPIPEAINQNEGTPKEAQPGAYRHVGPGYRPASVHSESSDGESCPSPSPLAVDDTSLISSNQTNHQLPLITTDASLPLDGLVQANPVVEESSDEIVVTRQQAILVDDLESQNQTRKKEERKTKTRNQLGLLAFLMVLLVVFVIVVIVVTSKNGDQARVDDNIEVQSSKNDTMPATEHNDDNDVFPVISPICPTSLAMSLNKNDMGVPVPPPHHHHQAHSTEHIDGSKMILGNKTIRPSALYNDSHWLLYTTPLMVTSGKTMEWEVCKQLTIENLKPLACKPIFQVRYHPTA
ncbi:expressed unknown protein [Seminavis robusta]|uniref:Uncharacterized protein n=1 Tax=Seminavis robusta TaxID=568900 RepID=A0A9N8ES43_9STRA|nr:expressed unknown protein [Seminavis robusta]|eukprot:Sro1624_g286720.1 n/a (373) ;mRNA; f:23966-25084